MAKKKKKMNHKEEDSKLFAWIATFFSIIGFVVALLVKRDNKYVMHYASQSLIIFAVAVAAGIIETVLGWIPVLGAIITVALWILIFLLWLFSWIYALSGDVKDVPIVADWARKLKL